MKERPLREKVFPPSYSQNSILYEKFNPKINTIRVLFPKSRHFFKKFLKKSTGNPLPSASYAPEIS